MPPLAALAAEQPIPQSLKAFELISALAPARLKGDALTLRNDSANFCQGNHGTANGDVQADGHRATARRGSLKGELAPGESKETLRYKLFFFWLLTSAFQKPSSIQTLLSVVSA